MKRGARHRATIVANYSFLPLLVTSALAALMLSSFFHAYPREFFSVPSDYREAFEGQLVTQTTLGVTYVCYFVLIIFVVCTYLLAYLMQRIRRAAPQQQQAPAGSQQVNS